MAYIPPFVLAQQATWLAGSRGSRVPPKHTLGDSFGVRGTQLALKPPGVVGQPPPAQ